eukprot:scaffold368223_cov16-Prasinocladus_malaysianus.AAC.1
MHELVSNLSYSIPDDAVIPRFSRQRIEMAYGLGIHAVEESQTFTYAFADAPKRAMQSAGTHNIKH